MTLPLHLEMAGSRSWREPHRAPQAQGTRTPPAATRPPFARRWRCRGLGASAGRLPTRPWAGATWVAAPARV